MSFPNTQAGTTHLDAGSDDPSQAREDLLLTVQNLNTIIAGAGAASGVALLNSNGQVPSNQMPNSIAPTSGVLALAPTSGVVKIEDVLRLQILTFDTIQALTGTEGDVVYCADGAAGNPCLAVYNGTNWLRITLGAAIATS